MKKIFFILLLLLGLYCPSSIVTAQSRTLKFETINEEQNLSHNSVTGIAQDDQGFIWISTIDGLNRFDGYSCKVYKHIPGDSASISGNRTGGIYFDSRGYLWIGAYGFGLNRFNPKTEKFKHYIHDDSDSNSISSNYVSGIIEESNGDLWIGTKQGLNLLKRGANKFIHFFHDPKDDSSIAGNEISSPYEDSKGNIWITTIDGGLSMFNAKTASFTNYRHDPRNPNSIGTNNLNTIREDKFGYLWISTYQGGLEKFDPAKKAFTHFRYSPSRNSLSNDIVYSIYIDKFNNVWAGTRNGISILNTSTGLFTNYISYPNMKHSLSNNNIDKFFEDRDGNIWITTYGGGVNRVIPETKKFLAFRNNPNDANSLSNNFVTSITEIGDKIFIGTVGGLNIYDRVKKKWKLLTRAAGRKNSVSGNEIGALLKTKSGKLWVGTRGNGIDVFNTATGKKIITYNNRNALPGDDIIRLYQDKSGKIWILTAESGVCVYNPAAGKFNAFPENSGGLKHTLRPRAILIDRLGNLWIGSYKEGIYLYNKDYKLVNRFQFDPSDDHSLGNNTIWDVFESGDGKIWICTDGGGINLYNPELKNFVRFTTADGLPNDVTYAIEEDKNGFLWISANKGISKFNPARREFRNFTLPDGLQDLEFNSGASFKNRKGEIFFGGVNGFNLFDPSKIKINENPQKVVFTSLKIENREANLDTAITYLKNLTLSYDDRVFTIEFAGLEYRNTKENQYAYILEGFSDNWMNSDGKRFATYTNLNPGNYVFKVKASNGDGIWSAKPAVLRITITPPFYEELWFRLVFGLLILSAVIGTVGYFSTKKLKKQVHILEKEKAVQEERERISRDLHDNIGSQLTFLISSLDNLSYSQKKIDIKERLNKLGEFGR